MARKHTDEISRKVGPPAEGNCYLCRKLTPYRCGDHPNTFRCEDCDCESGPMFGLPTCRLTKEKS